MTRVVYIEDNGIKEKIQQVYTRNEKLNVSYTRIRGINKFNRITTVYAEISQDTELRSDMLCYHHAVENTNYGEIFFKIK